MGHLAQRYLDASRSGVYRVSDAEVPGRAAIEAGSTLTRVAVADAGSASAVLEKVLADRDPAPRVLIIEGADTLAAERAADFSALVAALHVAAGARRERGAPFYAVLVDPRRLLALPNLYRERVAPA